MVNGSILSTFPRKLQNFWRLRSSKSAKNSPSELEPIPETACSTKSSYRTDPGQGAKNVQQARTVEAANSPEQRPKYHEEREQRWTHYSEDRPRWMPFQHELQKAVEVPPMTKTLPPPKDQSVPARHADSFGESDRVAYPRWPRGTRLQPRMSTMKDEEARKMPAVMQRVYGIPPMPKYADRKEPGVEAPNYLGAFVVPRKPEFGLTLGAALQPDSPRNHQAGLVQRRVRQKRRHAGH
jgi:hypothetical protein